MIGWGLVVEFDCEQDSEVDEARVLYDWIRSNGVSIVGFSVIGLLRLGFVIS